MTSFRRCALSFSLVLALGTTAVAQTPAAPTAPTTPAAPAATAPATDALLKPEQVSATGQRYKDYLSKRYAGDEQATRVIRLFGRRQVGGALWLGTGAGFIGFVASQTGTRTDPSGGTTTVTVTPVGWAFMLGLFGGVGIGKLARFSNVKLYEALAQYEQSRTLPHYVARRID